MRRSKQKPSIRRVLNFILPGVVCLVLTWLYLMRGSSATAAPAQFDLDSPDAVPIPVVSEHIGGFELFQNGIYWWNTGGEAGSECGGGEFYYVWTLKQRGVMGASTKNVVNQLCQAAPDNVVRDSQYFYYVDHTQHLVRKAVNATPNTPSTQLTQAGTINHSLLAIDSLGRLYWSIRVDNALMIMRMKADNSEAPIIFAGMIGVTSDVKQLVAYQFYSPRLVTGIAFLLENGDLWRHHDNEPPGTKLLDTGISAFWPRVSRSSPLNEVVTFYAAKGNTLRRMNAEGLGPTLYAGNPNPQPNQFYHVSDVTVDDVNIYLTEETGYINCPGGGFCGLINVTINRRALGAANDAAWDLLVAQGGGNNLSSDGQFVYFSPIAGIPPNPTSIAKVPTNAPPVQIDVEVLDLEVTQAIQDMKEGISLVAGHPTVVRGYARLATSTDGASYHINATLTGKLNGQLLPEALSSVRSITVDTTTSKQTMRNNATHTFLFVLPESWVKDVLPILPDQLQLELTVNRPSALPENVGSDPFANNKMSAIARVGIAVRPCLMMNRVRADGMPVLSANPPGLAQSVAYARYLMPISDFQVFSLEPILSKGGSDYEMDKNNDDPKDDTNDGALRDLDDFDMLSSFFPFCSSVHWVGMLHPDSPVWFGGEARINDNVLLAKIDGGAGKTLAHELAHNFGRRHIQCGTFPPGQDKFDFTPYDPCNLYYTNLPLEDSYYGLDFFDLNHVQVKPPQNHPDIMSYAWNTWTSYLYWQTLMTAIPIFGPGTSALAANVQTTPAVGELLYVSGDLDFTSDTAAFNTVYRLPDGVAPPSKVAQSLQEQQVALLTSSAIAAGDGTTHDASNATIRQLNLNGTLLGETVVLTKELGIHIGDQHRYSFSQYLPYNPETTKVQIVHNNQVLAERIASAHPPTLTLATPVLDDVAATITLRWSASDSDGDALHAMILYSNDDGAHWLPLEKNMTGLEATFDTQSLAGSANARMRLIVDDGFYTVVATSSPFIVNKHAPTPLIDGVVEQQRVPYTATTTLFGLGLDAEEGSIDGATLDWSLSGPSSRIYSGTQVILAGLTPGQYSITLTAKDSDGLTGATTRHFEVLPLPVPEGGVPMLDGLCSDAAYADAVAVSLNKAGAQLQLMHKNSLLYACFSGLQRRLGARSNLAGLRVDINNSRDVSAQVDDRGFFIDQDGIPFQTAGNGSDMPITLDPVLGYAAAVSYINLGWSAELAIDDALVGGWGHAAGVLFQYDVITHTNNSNNWPVGGVYNQPSSWAPALFGSAPVVDNRAPIANAGGDQTRALSEPTIIALDSNASYDADLDTLTPTWSQIAGPTVSLTHPTTSTIRFTANPVSATTVLRFQLTVSDGKTVSSPDEVEITLLPPEPIMGGVQTKSVYLPLVVR